MAIYTGFFDAAFDETTSTYDNEYDSADFTTYFGEIVGSGVCVYGNDDSMRVYYDAVSNRAVVNPGYLFIRGYWLKNDGLYTVSLESLSAGTYAIYAELNLGSRGILISQKAKVDPEVYPDAIVLAYATIDIGGAISIEDTRSRTDICGLIDSAGSLSMKIEYAINYIDNEIEEKLNQIEQNLQQKEAEIDSKIEEVNALISQIAPPAIGTIKFSASQNIEEGWIKCDGSFISETDYPELVAALGKLIPSSDKFQLINYIGDIPSTGITNFVLYDDILWTYCVANKTLYGIPVEGGTLKSITLSSEDTRFNNFIASSFENPLALSIVPHKKGSGAKIFLAQIFKIGYIQPVDTIVLDDLKNITSTSFLDCMQIFDAEFNLSSSSINLKLTIQTIKQGSVTSNSKYNTAQTNKKAIPYVTSIEKGENETYYCAVGQRIVAYVDTYDRYDRCNVAILTWNDDDKEGDIVVHNLTEGEVGYCKFGFSEKNKNEIVTVIRNTSGNTTYYTSSFPQGIFGGRGSVSQLNSPSNLPMAIAGFDKTLFSFDKSYTNFVSKNNNITKELKFPITTPDIARTFIDAGQYLFDKDIYFIFVGTGIIFSRTFDSDSVGYLDTTSVLGTIVQYGDLRYDDQTGTLYIMGQDTKNKVKVAKIVLNTLYDYANDGAWLPLIASDGVPAYIKAKESTS